MRKDVTIHLCALKNPAIATTVLCVYSHQFNELTLDSFNMKVKKCHYIWYNCWFVVVTGSITLTKWLAPCFSTEQKQRLCFSLNKSDLYTHYKNYDGIYIYCVTNMSWIFSKSFHDSVKLHASRQIYTFCINLTIIAKEHILKQWHVNDKL